MCRIPLRLLWPELRNFARLDRAVAVDLQLTPVQITRQGRYLVDSTGARYVIRGARLRAEAGLTQPGVAYQPQGTIAAATAANDAQGGFPGQ